MTERALAAVEEHERGVLQQRARQYRGERQRLGTRAGRSWWWTTGWRPAPRRSRPAGSRAPAARRGSCWRFPWRRTTGRPASEARRTKASVCTPPWLFYAIGQFYTTSGRRATRRSSPVWSTTARCTPGPTHRRPRAAPPQDAPPPTTEVRISGWTGAALDGRLTVPRAAPPVCSFADGSGSSRKSPRNRFVATGLNRAGLGTLLFDLLTEAEAVNRDNVFDTALLARRLIQATEWLREQPGTEGMAFGYFGASTGAAAALWAAAQWAADVAAVVSRGGRPDLAGARLPEVKAPTLLVVGGRDHVVLDLNRQAAARLEL